MSERTLLVVEDDAVTRGALRRFFNAKGFVTLEAETGAAALDHVRTARPEVAIVDFRLPDLDGIELLRRLRADDPTLPVVILTGHASIELAVRAVKEGADQFLTKPVELGALQVMVERLIENRRHRHVAIARESRRSQRTIDPFLGESAAIRSLAERAGRVAQSSLPVMIHGETGVGKGVLAAWLHENGPRASEAFVDLNCAGLTAELLETELFGHQKGAFTGAVASKVGLLEVADRGTAFLDEIGDIPLAVQAKLLKVVEDQRFRRLGDVADRHVDVRLLAASHRDLPRQVAEGRFREDLYYRINVVSLRVPPLRERLDDLEILARSLVRRIAAELDKPDLALSASAEAALCRHSWPGNLRELRNVIERAALLTSKAQIEAADLELAESRSALGREMGDLPDAGDLSLDAAERRHIAHVLELRGGNVVAAAAALGLSKSALYQRLKKLGIAPPGASRQPERAHPPGCR